MSRRSHALKVTRLVVVVFVFAGCSGGPGATRIDTFAPPTTAPSIGPAGANWTGTITLRALIDESKSETGDNDQDPNSTYYATYTREKTVNEDVTDKYTLTGEDPTSLTYGIHSVGFTGTVENSGTSQFSDVYLWDKRNSGCTWKQEDGDEWSGSWSGQGDPEVSLEFSEDGSYTVFVRPNPTGERATFPHRSWSKSTDISANCEQTEPDSDVTIEAGPLIEWVSERLGDPTTDGGGAVIEGSLSRSNDGVVEGSDSWELERYEELFADPESPKITITASWRFVRDGPIELPHD
jgi:hypothetical protein